MRTISALSRLLQNGRSWAKFGTISAPLQSKNGLKMPNRGCASGGKVRLLRTTESARPQLVRSMWTTLRTSQNSPTPFVSVRQRKLRLSSKFLCTATSRSSSKQFRRALDSGGNEAPQLEVLFRRVMQSQHLEDRMDRIRIVSGACLILGLGVYVYGELIVLGFSGGVAEVTGSEAVQTQVNLLAKAVVTTVLNDSEVLHRATEFIAALSADPATQQALTGLLVLALQHKSTQQEVNRLSADVVAYILDRPETTEQVVELLQRVLADPKTHARVILLMQQMLENPVTREALATLMISTLNRSDVQATASHVGKTAAHDILNSSEVYEHSTQWIAELMGQRHLQKSSGQHLWNAFTYSITPSLLNSEKTASEREGADGDGAPAP